MPHWHKVKQVTPKFIYHATESHGITVPCHPMTGEKGADEYGTKEKQEGRRLS